MERTIIINNNSNVTTTMALRKRPNLIQHDVSSCGETTTTSASNRSSDDCKHKLDNNNNNSSSNNNNVDNSNLGSTPKVSLSNRPPSSVLHCSVHDDDDQPIVMNRSPVHQRRQRHLSSSSSFWRKQLFVTTCNSVIHFIALLCFIFGFIFRAQFHTGEECDMTYSMREFLPVQTQYNNNNNNYGNNNNMTGTTTSTTTTTTDTTNPIFKEDHTWKVRSVATRSYRLYKFVDRRDPRYRKQLQAVETSPDQPLSRSEHCKASYGSSLGTTSNSASSTSSGKKNSTINNYYQHLHIVLYIPGHWGSYSQARSLGAHGIQLTKARDSNVHTIQRFLATPPHQRRRRRRRRRQQQQRQQQDDDDDNNTIDTFVYEVYSVDFAEQGGALHGNFLTMQSEFVSSIIEQLVQDCHTTTTDVVTTSDGITMEGRRRTSITLVAHSMGGYVARWALIDHPELKRYVKNIITLASPHSNPLYAFDKSIHDIHQRLMKGDNSHRRSQRHDDEQEVGHRIYDDDDDNDNDTLIVSLSGGLRDEMIAPGACEVSHVPNSISVLSTRLMADSVHNGNDRESNEVPSNLGMDHRAIVWCHQVLHEVRRIMWAMVISDHLPVQERRSQVLAALSSNGDWNNDSYILDVDRLDEGLTNRFGWWKALCLKSALLYHLPFLFALYGLISALKYNSFIMDGTMNVEVFLAIPLGWYFGTIDFPTTVVLALVADTISFVLVNIITVGFYRRNGYTAPKIARPRRCIVGFFAATLFLGGCLCQIFLFNDGGFLEYWDCILYLSVVVTTYAALVFWLGLLRNNNKGRCSIRNSATSDRRVGADLHFITWTMLTIPVVLVGPLTLMAWEKTTRMSSWMSLLWIHFAMGLMLAAKCIPRGAPHARIKQLEAIARVSFIVAVCPWTLATGNGYLAPLLPCIVGLIDIVFALLSYVSS